MEQAKYYSRSPIVEARMDIKVKLSPETGVADLMQIANAIEDEYAIDQQYFSLNGQITVDDAIDLITTSANKFPIGYGFIADDKKRRVQSRLDGFTFSQFRPYPGWANFQQTARTLWESYEQTTNPIEIESLSLRYINRIEVSSASGSLKEYFTTSSEIPPDLPQTPSTYLLHLQLPIDEINSIVQIVQARVPLQLDPIPLDSIFVLLDINITTQGTISKQTEDIWQQLSLIHQHTNRVFEAFITDKTRESIR